MKRMLKVLIMKRCMTLETSPLNNCQIQGDALVLCFYAPTKKKETPPELPSRSHFEWVNLSDLKFMSPQHYGLLETDGQLRALCGVLDTKGMDSLVLDESRFITYGKSEFKAYSGHLHKLHNNKANVRALSMRKHLGPLQFQEKLVNSQNNG
ncbi:hypothetical protein PIB30_057836 [Stylosanthes scabra]|uniref:Uncharacterized protein n=1 Tax=Stylosanthes scabra TaxID=79078 RepID=A0ABU6UJM2_9FABA|nr:hypothetical protein [Stylosanthes scabra]